MNPIDRFMEIEAGVYKGASYRSKGNSLKHKIIAYLVKPFNPHYLRDVTTTVFPHTDFGTEVMKHPSRMLNVEFHENVHKWDFRNGPIKAMLKYAFPQLYALPFIVAAIVLSGIWGYIGLGFGVIALHEAHLNTGKDGDVTPKGRRAFSVLMALAGLSVLTGCIYGGGWWTLLLLGAALFISPWPLRAVWRRDYELRGYTASLYVEWLRHGRIRDDVIDWYVLQFTGPAYFYMETRRKYVREALEFQIRRFSMSEPSFLSAWENYGRGKPSEEAAEPFRMIRRFYDQEKRVDA